jgi:hypothetical protein
LGRFAVGNISSSAISLAVGSATNSLSGMPTVRATRRGIERLSDPLGLEPLVDAQREVCTVGCFFLGHAAFEPGFAGAQSDDAEVVVVGHRLIVLG